MSKVAKKPDPLRAAAEAQLASPHPAEKLLHELRVHQIELEMQNEHLREAQAVIEEMRDRYVDVYELAPVGYFTLNRAGRISEVNLTGAAQLGVVRKELLNEYFARFVSPECVDPWTHHFRSVLRRDGRQGCELSIQRLDGSHFSAQITSLKTGDSLSSHISDDSPPHNDVLNKSISLRLVITDITERKQQEVLLQRFGSLLQDSFNEIYLFDAESLNFILTSEGAKKNLGYSDEELFQLTPLDLKPSFTRESFEEIIAPLRKGTQTLLHFETVHRRKDGTTYPVEVRMQLMTTTTTTTTTTFLAIIQDLTERKRAEQKLRDLTAHLQHVREEEKAGIAREIHDDLGGTLTSLKMETHWLKTELPAHKEATGLLNHVWEMSKLIDHAAEVMRNIISGLRPTVLDELGLCAALEWKAARFQKSNGIECRVNCIEGKGDLDKHRSIELFRIAQEALTNVVKHSGASSVDIEYIHGDDEIVMSIIDNGRGLVEERSDASIPYGILGMTERVDQLGGKISFNTSSRGGFNVTVTLPLGKEKT